MKTYKDQDCNLKFLKGETVAIIGYGIQGKAQSLNLRDSGVKVIVYNRNDNYHESGIKDGFKIYPIEEAVKKATIILMLIPDQAQKDVFHKFIAPNIKVGSMLVVAHGYSIRFKQLIYPDNIDVILLAPRFPGDVLRNNYLNNKGTLAFFDVHHDYTGRALKKGLALAKAIGFTKGGGEILKVSLEEETEIDLFIEQFLIPSFLQTIQTGFDVLIENGYTPEIALIELYTSGEIIGLLKEGIISGLYRSFQNNTSPTCQFGVKESFNRIITEETKNTANMVLQDIKNGIFSKKLSEEAMSEYPTLREFNKSNNNNKLMQTQERLIEMGSN